MAHLVTYTDYKSPYAYLAKDPTYDLARDFGIEIEWRPYILDIPSYLGSATLDDAGRVIEQDRNGHQWRRVRYSYMDCRRQARKRGLVIRGTRKIWDSTLAAAGMLFAQRSGAATFRAYNDTVFARFWTHDLDIENPADLAEVLRQAGAPSGFEQEAEALRTEVAAISRAAEDTGVFGVPSYVIDGELFWGREHLEDIRARLGG